MKPMNQLFQFHALWSRIPALYLPQDVTFKRLIDVEVECRHLAVDDICGEVR